MIKDGTAEFIAVDARAAAIFDLIYPIGSVFATTGNAPARGTWEEIAQGRTLQGADANHAAGTTIEAGLPNIKNTIKNILHDGVDTYNGALRLTHEAGEVNWGQSFFRGALTFDASFANPIYGASSTVQPPAYVVHFYRRTV